MPLLTGKRPTYNPINSPSRKALGFDDKNTSTADFDRATSSKVAVLRCDVSLRSQGIYDLQPHLHADVVHGSGERVLELGE